MRLGVEARLYPMTDAPVRTIITTPTGDVLALDAKVTFRFPQWHYSLFMEMQNINKEYGQTYIKNIGTSEVFYPGQRFFAGASLKF